MWFSHNLEFVTDSTGATGASGAGEVVARLAARTPHPTRAGGQDDGSYTNSLKKLGCKHLKAEGPEKDQVLTAELSARNGIMS